MYPPSMFAVSFALGPSRQMVCPTSTAASSGSSGGGAVGIVPPPPPPPPPLGATASFFSRTMLRFAARSASADMAGVVTFAAPSPSYGFTGGSSPVPGSPSSPPSSKRQGSVWRSATSRAASASRPARTEAGSVGKIFGAPQQVSSMSRPARSATAAASDALAAKPCPKVQSGPHSLPQLVFCASVVFATKAAAPASLST